MASSSAYPIAGSTDASSMSPSPSEEPRFTEYTPTDHQVPLWIATSITLTYAGLFLVVRLAIKYKLWEWDDLALAVAHVRSERKAFQTKSSVTAS